MYTNFKKGSCVNENKVSSTAFLDKKTEKLICHRGDIIYFKKDSLQIQARDVGNVFFPKNRTRAL